MCPMVRRAPGIELALLGFLRENPQHGYQIHLHLNSPDGLGPIWKLKQSQLYSLLSKLEKDGLTTGVVKQQEDARPPRRVFHLTRAGQTAFQKWLQTPVSVPNMVRQDFMAKLYFSQQEGPEKVKNLVELQRATCQKWLEELKAEKEQASAFAGSLHSYRVGQITAIMNWLDTAAVVH